MPSARATLGGDRYDELHGDGAQLHPVSLVRNTLDVLDRVSARGATTVGTSGVLTPREREIVALVAEGITNRAIAERLFISERTVDTHITRIRRKLGTTTRTQLVIWALPSIDAVPGPR